MLLHKKILKNYLESFIGHDEDLVEKFIDVSGAVIIKQDEKGNNLLLLIRRSPDDNWPHVWEFPRGKCKNKETLKICLKREVKEETGLDIEVIKYIDEYEYIADEGKRKSTQHNYLCKMKNPNQELKLSFEHSEFMWIHTFAQVELMVPTEMKKTIFKVFNVNDKIVDYAKVKSQEIKERLKKDDSIRDCKKSNIINE
jgi:8-oxo-dGTP pyrophosphatase MutT (NUDIX family)